jgi:putative phosphoesterase
LKIGVISDTHDLVRPEALAALAGVELIVHGGDVCRPEVLETLRGVAPVRAVRGNNDRGAWAAALPETEAFEVLGRWIYVIHDLKQLDVDPAGFDVIISGHSHQPAATVRGGVLYFNPGSAGPRRFHLPVSLGYLHLDASGVRPELVTLL